MRPASSDRLATWTLIAIVLLAIAVRLPQLLHAGLWRDEAYVWVDLSAPTFGEFWHRITTSESHPPLYFMLVYAWTKLFGSSEMALE